MDISKQEFVGKTIRLDGDIYRDCVFRHCTMIYTASGKIGLVDCRLIGCKWRFEGAAAETIKFMQALYAQGGTAGSMLEMTFHKIRGKQKAEPVAG